MRSRQEPLLSLETILWLQTTCGNRAVQRLLKRKAMQRELEQKEATGERESRSQSRRKQWGWWQWILRWLRRKGAAEAGG
jgi:hypothetical protein